MILSRAKKNQYTPAGCMQFAYKRRPDQPVRLRAWGGRPQAHLYTPKHTSFPSIGWYRKAKQKDNIAVWTNSCCIRVK